MEFEGAVAGDQLQRFAALAIGCAAGQPLLQLLEQGGRAALLGRHLGRREEQIPFTPLP